MRKTVTARQKCLLSSLIYQHTCSFAALSIPPLLPLLSMELGLTAGQAGLIMFSLYLATAITALPSGFLVDLFRERFLVVFSVGMLSLGLLVMSFAADFATAFVAAFVMGIGYSVSGPLSTKMVALVFEGKERATALGVKQTGTSSGSALASFILPPIAAITARSSAFISSAAIALATIPLILYSYVSPGKVKSKTNERFLRTVLSRSTVTFLLGAFGLGFSIFAMLTHLPLFLTRDVGFSVVEAGFVLAVVNFFSVLGRIGLGVLADRFFVAKRTAVLLLSSAVAVAASAIFVVSVGIEPFMSLFPLALLGFFLFGSIGVVFTVGSELVDGGKVGATSGMTYFCLALGNATGPLIFGQIADVFGYWSAWRLYLLFVGLCTLSFFFSWHLGKKIS